MDVYGTYNYSIPGVYKPTNITGGPQVWHRKGTDGREVLLGDKRLADWDGMIKNGEHDI